MQVRPGCTGKQPFPTRDLAVKVTRRARRNKRRRHGDGEDWTPEPYRCPYCRCWHLGRGRL
jgi:hypothetical protein